MAIKYAAGRIEVDQSQLVAWTGWLNGPEMRLAGPCPACRHDTSMAVAQQVTALEAAGGPHVLAVSLACACEQAHAGRPDGAGGCGRHWACTATTGADGAVILSRLSDPTLVAAADALRAAEVTQLADLRGAVEKWIGGVTALFGLFGLAGAVIARSTAANLPSNWQVAIAVVVACAVALAGAAILATYRAAYGWPVTRVVADNDELLDWYAAREAAPRVQAGYLRNGVRAAGGALLALVVALGLLFFAPQAQPAVPTVRVTLTSGSQVCGTLLPAAAGATVVRRASDGTAVDIRPRSITAMTPVTSC